MHKTSAWAALYFIALMTFGNYVLFNLLVAILVEGFSTQGEDQKKREEQEKEKQKEAEAAALEAKKLEKDTNKHVMKQKVVKVNEDLRGDVNEDPNDVKNNKEKEEPSDPKKKMFGLPPSVSVTKDDNVNMPLSLAVNFPESGPLNPPIITHTAATPANTPQGSPNEASNNNKDMKNSLSVARAFDMSSLSIDSIDKSSSTLSVRSSPKLSPGLVRKESTGRSQRGWLGILKNKEDNKSLVDSQSDSGDEGEGDAANNNKTMPRRNSTTNNYSDCNGHAPLNNQRTLSPQNSIKSYHTLSPRNSIKSHQSLSRQNSLSSKGCSRHNSFSLSRQNSINSHRTLSPQNSIGSGAPKDEYKPNNLTGTPDLKVPEEGEKEESDVDEDKQCPCKWCPEPGGVLYTRRRWPLYIIPPDSALRQKCRYLIEQKWFDYTVLFFIALNCITLAMERPDIPRDSLERKFLQVANYLFTVIFAFEMAVKVIAAGFALGPRTYLKSGWNVMDGFLVFISIIDIVVSLSATSGSPRIFGILRVFRLLRTLRPLRVISRAPGLKLVVQTLLSSLRPIGNIVLICCTFFIIFGILGVQLFKGTFYYCEGPDVHDVKNKTDCINKGPPFRWVNRKYNFDNLGQALMALFVLASKDGWVNIMYTGLDAVGVDQQPVENYSEWRLFYFISFLLLVGFFVLNMFVGVVVENFHKCRESQEQEERARRAAKRAKKLDKKRRSMSSSSQTPGADCDSEERSKGGQSCTESGEKDEASTLPEMREPPYWSNYSSCRLLIHSVCNSKYFDLAIAGVIGLNVITMAMEFYMMPEELQFALKIFNYFFTSVFILEAIVKIIALGFCRYIKDRWNQLDIAIVILSIVGIVLEEMKSNVIPINPTIIRVMRVLRIARVLKLLKMAKGIRALLDTVVQALPQVGNLGLLFFLLFFIFAALGVELFGRLECSEEHPCEGLGKHAHFQNFGMAFLTLFRVATGDNWNGIMKDTLREDCDASDNCVRNCCVSPIIAPVFFVVFVLMAQFVLVNVVVAVLMRHLEESHKSMDDDAELEAEIQRELEEEARLKAEQEAAALREKEDNAYNDSFLDEAAKRKALSKQTSLPPNFCFNVRPPSPDPSCLEDDIYDWRLTPSAIELALQNELEERAQASSYLDDDYPLTLVVPQLPGHDWPRQEHIPSNEYSSPSNEEQHSNNFKPRPKVGGLGYLPRQDALLQGSSGSLASAVSEPPSSRGSSSHLTPRDDASNQHLHGSVPNLPAGHETGDDLMVMRHHSQPSLFCYDKPQATTDNTTIMIPPPPPAEHRYSSNTNEYFPTLAPPLCEDTCEDHQMLPLTTFNLSGDSEEESDEGSDQDLLNSHTVFAPREDGAPESYHADNSPKMLEDVEEEEEDIAKDTDEAPTAGTHTLEMGAADCSAEVQNLVNNSSDDHHPQAESSGGTLNKEAETPDVHKDRSSPQEADADPRNLTVQEGDYNTQEPCDAELPDRCSDRHDTKGGDSNGDFPLPHCVCGSPSPPPYEQTAFYPDRSPQSSPSRDLPTMGEARGEEGHPSPPPQAEVSGNQYISTKADNPEAAHRESIMSIDEIEVKLDEDDEPGAQPDGSPLAMVVDELKPTQQQTTTPNISIVVPDSGPSSSESTHGMDEHIHYV